MSSRIYGKYRWRTDGRSHRKLGRSDPWESRLAWISTGINSPNTSGRIGGSFVISPIPSGSHNGRTIFYIFGRYPAEPDGDSYPVLDLVVCHGDFLNADHEYVHKNKSVKGFGSYGDIMIRDRKMYVAPTPFGLTSGTAHNQTLILPASFRVDSRFHAVGNLVKREAEKLILGYTFDLRTNTLKPKSMNNPAAGKEHISNSLTDLDTAAVRLLKSEPMCSVEVAKPDERQLALFETPQTKRSGKKAKAGARSTHYRRLRTKLPKA